MTNQQGRAKVKRSEFGAQSLLRLATTYLALALIDAFAVYLIIAFASDGVWELAITIGLIALVVNIINLRGDLYALRWISPALALMGLMVVFPIIYTAYVSLTNYGDGNLLTKQQVIKRLAQETYLPEGGAVYRWTLFQNTAGDYALWLTDVNAGDEYYFATMTSFDAVSSVAAGEDLPNEYLGYRQLNRGESLRASSVAQELTFGGADLQIALREGKKRANSLSATCS